MKNPPPDSQLEPLTAVPAGRRARLAGFNGLPAETQECLRAYGLVPGTWLLVCQHAPATVVQFENTELALENDLAWQIVVDGRTMPGAGPACPEREEARCQQEDASLRRRFARLVRLGRE